MPSGRWNIAVVGHISTHGASAHWLQRVDLEMPADVRVSSDLDLLDVGAIDAKGNVVFLFARDGAGMTADALAVVDYLAPGDRLPALVIRPYGHRRTYPKSECAVAYHGHSICSRTGSIQQGEALGAPTFHAHRRNRMVRGYSQNSPLPAFTVATTVATIHHTKIAANTTKMSRKPISTSISAKLIAMPMTP